MRERGRLFSNGKKLTLLFKPDFNCRRVSPQALDVNRSHKLLQKLQDISVLKNCKTGFSSSNRKLSFLALGFENKSS